MPVFNAKTMALETVAQIDRLSDSLEADRQKIAALRADAPRFFGAHRATIKTMSDSLESFEAEYLNTLDEIDASLVERLEATRDQGAVPQDGDAGMKRHGARMTGTDG